MLCSGDVLLDFVFYSIDGYCVVVDVSNWFPRIIEVKIELFGRHALSLSFRFNLGYAFSLMMFEQPTMANRYEPPRGKYRLPTSFVHIVAPMFLFAQFTILCYLVKDGFK